MIVTLLTQDQCRLCDDAKLILERLMLEYGFSMRVLAFDSEEGIDLASRGGLLFPPGIAIDDTPFSYGRLSEGRLRRALEARSAVSR